MRSRAVFASGLLLLAALPSLAEDMPSGKEVVIEKIRLSRRTPNEVMGLLISPTVTKIEPGGFGGAFGGGRFDPKDSVVPPEITGVLGYPLDNSLIARGTPAALQLLKHGVRVIDVQIESLPDKQVRVTLKPGRSDLQELRAAVLKLPMAGMATAQERELVLEGRPEWLHRAQRLVMQAEMRPAERKDPPAPNP